MRGPAQQTHCQPKYHYTGSCENHPILPQAELPYADRMAELETTLEIHPTPVFETYWRFAAERQAIYFRRAMGKQAPWTQDPILRAYRFTNAYRASDRVSQYLIREVQYRHDRRNTPDELFFRTMLFKFFNRIDTWEALEKRFGEVSWRTFDLTAATHALDELMSRGQRVYSAAYIMPSPPFGHSRKHANHLCLLKQMMDERVPDRVRQAPTLEAVYDLLVSYPGIGPFLAFQYAIDLNYSELLTHDEGSFVVAGPGAMDGIAKCFEMTGNHSAREIIHWVCDRQDEEFARLGLSFQTLFGRRLQPIDCQNLFCEISKYARVAHPDVRGISGRTKIKQSYRPEPTALPAPFFPHRWGLKIPESDNRSHVSRLGLVA